MEKAGSEEGAALAYYIVQIAQADDEGMRVVNAFVVRVDESDHDRAMPCHVMPCLPGEAISRFLDVDCDPGLHFRPEVF